MKFLLWPFWMASVAVAGPGSVSFHGFEYEGRDARFAAPLADGSYRNPILAGFYPDPSVCRVGDDFYLVNSSFSWFPGIPIFHSRDLVHWRQIGHVLDRPSQLDLDGLGVSRGVFAPTIEFHDGVFYVLNTLVDAGGNFFVTATDPAGPWSDPVWLPEIDGIDPSIFFDDDGRAYVVNNGPPPDGRPLYDGHRAIWIQELDVASGRLTGPREIVVNGGVDLARKPVWIEGPHIFKKDGRYYLNCAEGGTAEDHSQVIFRSDSVRGPYVPWSGNPMLTQRDLDPARPEPVTCTGHADLVETPTGDWWAVFLGCRPYEDNLYNTGRETFLLPVTWSGDGWPRILPPGQAVPAVAPAPKLPAGEGPFTPLNGDLVWRDEFNRPALDPLWIMLRTPRETWWSLTAEPGSLRLQPRAERLAGQGNPSFLARRQQHAAFVATTALSVPAEVGVAAGLVAFQNEDWHFFLGVRRTAAGVEVFLERAAGAEPEVIAAAEMPAGCERVSLRIAAEGRPYSFSWAVEPDAWQVLAGNIDGSVLSTHAAGGFVGTCLGLHARTE